MRVLHVTPSFFPATVYGGPIESALGLCTALASDGCRVTVLTTNADGRRSVLDVVTDTDIAWGLNMSVRYCHRILPHSVSATLLRSLESGIEWADVVHVTGLYSFPTLPVLFAARRKNKPVVLSPRGALMPGTQHRAALKCLWRRAVASLASTLIFHVTSGPERRWTERSFRAFRTAVVPNGVNVPESPTLHQRRCEFRILALGRLHPIKGLENLIDAAGQLSRTVPEWHLTIAGEGEPKYVAELHQRVAVLGLQPRISFTGAVTRPRREALYTDADVVVVPSHSESFGMTVVEALAHSVPVVVSRGAPWRRVEEIGCGLWIDNDPATLASALARMVTMPLEAMGQRGREWMRDEFSWPAVANQMRAVYQGAIDVAARA